MDEDQLITEEQIAAIRAIMEHPLGSDEDYASLAELAEDEDSSA
ncbi:MAG: hypothetical protein AB7F88_19810 [Pyrinomonadaceae bacterium]